jgi:tRNA/rRNA methyltransferase
MDDRVTTKHVTIVLNKPKYSANIGLVARCAVNMGIERLFVITNGRQYDQDEIKRTATHCASGFIKEEMRYFDRLDSALSQCNYVVGTTARTGNTNLKRSITTPRKMAAQLTSISCENDVALLFGPEDRGLTNNELRYCDLLVTIPTSGRLKSINLSHAVMVLCYEIFVTENAPRTAFSPRLATSKEKEDMFDHLKDIFIKINFINPENPEYWMTSIRNFFSRTKLHAKDVKIVRGVCRQIDLYGRGKTKSSETVCRKITG